MSRRRRGDDEPELEPHPWFPGTFEVSSNLTTFAEKTHEFLTKTERDELAKQDAADRLIWAERGFSIGFGEYDREVVPGGNVTLGGERTRPFGPSRRTLKR